ncbi:MAG: hypothetical protein JXR37_03920, partial [Kiritimatiellae bacterium]|nr:hypothetical protein [Kiritimatiellia bacterium]
FGSRSRSGATDSVDDYARRLRTTISGSIFLAERFGWSDVLPVPADYDGDGRADPAVYHPAGGMWYILASREGFRTHHFGWPAALPAR